MYRLASSPARSDFTLLMILLSAAVCIAIHPLRRRLLLREKRARLTRRKILFLAWGREALCIALPAAALGLLLLASWLCGGVGSGTMLGSAGILALSFGAVLLIRYRQMQQLLRMVLDEQHAPLPATEELVRIRGIWSYTDRDWFIRIGMGHFAALYAPEMDFSTPVQGDYQAPIKNFSGGWLRLQFRRRDGGQFCALYFRNAEIEAWLRAQGGCFSDEVPKSQG